MSIFFSLSVAQSQQILSEKNQSVYGRKKDLSIICLARLLGFNLLGSNNDLGRLYSKIWRDPRGFLGILENL